jgi:hypothetical protein
MNKKLISKIYNQVQRAYWANHNYCGSDFNLQNCDGCCTYEFCKEDAEIMEELNSLSEN